MHRAMELARLGFGNVSPNPMVGCVIVHDDKIIGEGFHQQYGSHHAEVNAIKSVVDKKLLPKSEVFVTLEPCSHFGKTPPCADLLVSHNVKKVYVSNLDPNPLVAGKGLEKFREAGIEVETDMLKTDSNALNKRYFTMVENKRPYIILKWAETADGFIARNNFDSKWISNDFSRKLVHKWRSEEDAILVGKNTALYDNPTLTVRDWEGKNPVRIVLDHNLQLDRKLNLFDQQNPTICYNLKKNEELENLSFVQLDEERFIHELLVELHKRQIQSVIVEGGAATLNAFIKAGLWDEARVFRAKTCFGNGLKAPQLLHAEFDGKEEIMGDTLTYFRRK